MESKNAEHYRSALSEIESSVLACFHEQLDGRKTLEKIRGIADRALAQAD